MKKIFIVGYPRSGTTMLQTLLMCDDNVFSVPETQIFNLGVYPVGWRRRVPLVLRLNWYCFCWFKRVFSQNIYFWGGSKDMIVNKFFAEIENKALDAGKSVLLEKTPGHAKHTEEIRRLFPGSSIVHLFRNNVDAVASMTHAAAGWGGNTDFSVNMRKWFEYTYCSFVAIREYGDVFVTYESLLSDLSSQVVDLNQRCDLNIPSQGLKEKMAELSKQVVFREETWKATNLSGSKLQVNYDVPEASDTILPQYIEFLQLISKY